MNRRPSAQCSAIADSIRSPTVSASHSAICPHQIHFPPSPFSALLQSKNDSVTQYAVPPEHIEHFGQSDFEQFIRQMVAKEEYFGPTKAPKVQAKIIDYFTRQFKVHSKRDSQFYLERYSMVKL